LAALVALGAARWAAGEQGAGAAVPELVGLRGLPRPTAVALVGGINELVLDAVEDGRGDRLLELAPTATAAVLAGLAPAPRPGAGGGAGRHRRAAGAADPRRWPRLEPRPGGRLRPGRRAAGPRGRRPPPVVARPSVRAAGVVPQRCGRSRRPGWPGWPLRGV